MVEYRPASHDDAPAVARLHAENWRRAYRGNFRDEYLDGDVFSERQRVWHARLGEPAPKQYVCVAVEGRRVVGFVCTFGSHDREWGSFIDNLHVQADLQRGGIGASLMRKAGEWLSSAFPNEPVYLFVWERNPALALYERLGGQNSGLVEKENPGGGVGRYFRIVWQQPHELAR
jgi:ribosomal protein S18 acetylase RimI-like enzyme